MCDLICFGGLLFKLFKDGHNSVSGFDDSFLREYQTMAVYMGEENKVRDRFRRIRKLNRI